MAIKLFYFQLILALFSSSLYAQTTINVNVNAGVSVGTMQPIWRDHYENHLIAGYGSNPSVTGPHIQYITDPLFSNEMKKLKPRFIRISLGRIDNPPNVEYYSTNISVLRNLPYEFYVGGNTMQEANNLANYNFSYVDSMIKIVKSMGAEPFLTMDYMPFTLSKDQTPNYQTLLPLLYNLAYDNSIRNSPPANNDVYGRVMYQLIKHCYNKFGVTYFEHWNEPDQQWTNPIMVKFFWTGDEYDLYHSYAAIAKEVSSDAALAEKIKIGGCSFAFYSLLNLIPIRFLQEVKNHNIKFDFLSFHPYSDVQFKGGYDSAKVALATQWRNTYVPNAELINAEWGRIDPTNTTYGDLDYGLHKIEHIIDMINRNVAMSFDVCLFDAIATNDNNASLGMYKVGPIAPKSVAYAFYNMNMMNDALNSLPLTINADMYALAGKNLSNDRVVVVLPAPNPIAASNTVYLNISNLPWGSGNCYGRRYELTESSFQNGIIFNQTDSSISSFAEFKDTVVYRSINNSGRLIVWELSSKPFTQVLTQSSEINVYPNPSKGNFKIKFDSTSLSIKKIKIFNEIGQIVLQIPIAGNSQIIDINASLTSGVYVLTFDTDKGIKYSKIVIQH